MSIDRRCDGCDERITSLETRAAVRISGMTATIHARLGQGAKTRLDLCADCWATAVDAIEQHVAELTTVDRGETTDG